MLKASLRILAAVNIAFAVALVTIPITPRDVEARGLFDCCKNSTSGQRFCCDNCCWISHDCSVDEQCGFEIE